jgi:hypothetical protein
MTTGSLTPNPEHADIAPLRDRALESLQLAIELFNRPTNTARASTVLMLSHHAFELLLKSIITARTGTAIDDERGYSYGFDKCLQIAEQQLKVTSKDQRKFLSMLDNLRDSAVHYYQLITEDMLYTFAQGAVSLFDELIRTSTGKSLIEYLPERVLPISGHPPKDVCLLVDSEFQTIKRLVEAGTVPVQEAIAAMRPLMAFAVGGEDQHRRMTTRELEVAIENLKSAQAWQVVFPEIAKLKFSTNGDGIPIRFGVTKESPDALPVRILKTGDPTPSEGVIINREVNILDKFNLGLNQLAENLGVSAPRTTALVREYKIMEDSECFREIAIGSQRHRRYSKKALDLLRTKVGEVETVWTKHRSALSRSRRSTP